MFSHRFTVNPRRSDRWIAYTVALTLGGTYFALWVFSPDSALGVSRLLVALAEGIAQ